jgi:hypothetical protein
MTSDTGTRHGRYCVDHAQVYAIAVSAGQVAPRQAGLHGARQLGGDGMGALDLFRVGKLAEIGPGNVLDDRGAFHPAFAGLVRAVLVGEGDLVGRLAALMRCL